MAKVAFVTGGNGITGGAIMEHLVRQTSAAEWSRIIVTSRSTLQTDLQDDRLEFLTLDFTQAPEDLAAAMRERCASVTHAYFSSYAHRDDFAALNAANEALFTNFLSALQAVAPALQNVTLQTGGKYYNLHLEPVPTPAREEQARRGAVGANFYHQQEDLLAARQQGQPWSWNVVRPEAIIGPTHKPNGMNSALTCALYFLISHELGVEARMPTNRVYWTGTETNSDAGLLAALTVWASTTPACANEAFNCVNGDHFVWRYMWPRLAEWFGAHATSEQSFETDASPVREGGVQQEFSLAEWAKDKRPVWDQLCERAGVPEAKATFDAATWAFQDWVFQRTWNATLSMNKARKFGWTGFKDSYESLTGAFVRFRELRQIP